MWPYMGSMGWWMALFECARLPRARPYAKLSVGLARVAQLNSRPDGIRKGRNRRSARPQDFEA